MSLALVPTKLLFSLYPSGLASHELNMSEAQPQNVWLFHIH